MTCPECSGNYYCNREYCPWCDAPRPSFLMARVLLRDPHSRDDKPRVVDMLAISPNEAAELTERITDGTSGWRPMLRVKFSGDRATLEPLDTREWRLVSPDGRVERLVGRPPVDLAIRDSRARWRVHAGPDDRLHRAVRFDLRLGIAR